MPYYGYARQDRKSGPRTPISAKLVANLITTAGANRVLTIDLHAGQIQGFFDIPIDNLFAAPGLHQRHQGALQRRDDLMIVSPDVGGVVRARAIAKRLDADLAIIDKRRERAGVSEVMNIIGDVKGRRCILVDDIVDSAGTLCNAAEALMEARRRVGRAYVTHGVLSGGAVARVCGLAAGSAGDHRQHPGDRGRARVAATSASSPSRRCSPRRCARISEERSVSSLFD